MRGSRQGLDSTVLSRPPSATDKRPKWPFAKVSVEFEAHEGLSLGALESARRL